MWTFKKRTPLQRRWETDPVYRAIADRYRERFTRVVDRSEFTDLFDDSIPRTSEGLIDFRGFEWDLGRVTGTNGDGRFKFRNIELDRVDFSEGAMTSVELRDCRVIDCRFRSVFFYDNHFYRSKFDRCDFSDSVLEDGQLMGRFDGCCFDRSRVKGIGLFVSGEFRECSFANLNWTREVSVHPSQFDRCTFSGLIRYVQITSARYVETDLRRTFYPLLRFLGVEVRQPASFSNCDCEGLMVERLRIPEEVVLPDSFVGFYEITEERCHLTRKKIFEMVLKTG